MDITLVQNAFPASKIIVNGNQTKTISDIKNAYTSIWFSNDTSKSVLGVLSDISDLLKILNQSKECTIQIEDMTEFARVTFSFWGCQSDGNIHAVYPQKKKIPDKPKIPPIMDWGKNPPLDIEFDEDSLREIGLELFDRADRRERELYKDRIVSLDALKRSDRVIELTKKLFRAENEKLDIDPPSDDKHYMMSGFTTNLEPGGIITVPFIGDDYKRFVELISLSDDFWITIDTGESRGTYSEVLFSVDNV